MSTGPRYQIRHRTRFDYVTPVTQSNNTLHLQPPTFPLQRTLSSLVRVLPATRLTRFQDLYDNPTHHFEITKPHLSLEIDSQLKVENLPLVILDSDLEAGFDAINVPEVRDITWSFLQPSRYVSFPPPIWRTAVDLTKGITPVFEQARTISNWIHENFTYQPESTHVHTHLEEVYETRAGVCQDFTHVLIGLCRAAAIPARYASGYLYNGPRGTLIGSQASHAWAEVYLPKSGWVGLDPTNGTIADERYIKAAVGRDYDDVAPIKGSYVGTAHARMQVDVQVELA